jgi:ankyrin repeat protein
MAHSGRPRKADPKVNDLRRNIIEGDFETAKKTLRDFGIDAEDGSGRTALINSVIGNKIEFLKWLIDNGANVNAQDRVGYSALHFVGQEKLMELGKLLLSKNANLELHDNYGNTPLWTAVMNSRKDLCVVKLFLDKGANVDSINNAGRTPGQMIKTIYGDTFEKAINELTI